MKNKSTKRLKTRLQSIQTVQAAKIAQSRTPFHKRTGLGDHKATDNRTTNSKHEYEGVAYV